MNDGQLERIRADGFVVVPGVIGPEAVAQLREAFACARSDSGTHHVDVDATMPHADRWAALCEHPIITRPIAELIGPAIVDHHGRNPLPGYGQQGLHADAPPRGRDGAILAVTAIWMLDAFTPSNGATRVVPGSHVRRDAVPRPYAQPDARHPDEVIVTGQAGDVLVFNGHLWHSGTRNRSDGPRRAVQMTARAAPVSASG